VRHKRFAIKPVSPPEAVEQMELLDHDFFVFENAETGQVNVLYRREDDNYGCWSRNGSRNWRPARGSGNGQRRPPRSPAPATNPRKEKNRRTA
jgi:hypothetical protein